MMRARVVHHSEYLALSLLLVGAAVWQKDQITAWFWFWLLGPDLFGYVPAFFFGRPPAKGHLPPRAVWLYNLWHNYTLPAALWIALLLLFAGKPMAAPRVAAAHQPRPPHGLRSAWRGRRPGGALAP